MNNANTNKYISFIKYNLSFKNAIVRANKNTEWLLRVYLAGKMHTSHPHSVAHRFDLFKTVLKNVMFFSH